jgi:tRNA pseudouridine synthase 10
MDVLGKAYGLLSKYSLCDHCLGRQFALLGYSMENNIRGLALKVSLVLQANDLVTAQKDTEGVKQLKVLATNGFSQTFPRRESISHLFPVSECASLSV